MELKPLGRDSILAIDDLPRKRVDVPEWGGFVHVRCMGGGERDRWEERAMANPNTDVRALLAVYTICDAAGNLLFTEADIPEITRKNARALDRIFSVSIRLSGITKTDIEELKKSSLEILSSDSNSNSRWLSGVRCESSDNGLIVESSPLGLPTTNST